MFERRLHQHFRCNFDNQCQSDFPFSERRRNHHHHRWEEFFSQSEAPTWPIKHHHRHGCMEFQGKFELPGGKHRHHHHRFQQFKPFEQFGTSEQYEHHHYHNHPFSFRPFGGTEPFEHHHHRSFGGKFEFPGEKRRHHHHNSPQFPQCGPFRGQGHSERNHRSISFRPSRGQEQFERHHPHHRPIGGKRQVPPCGQFGWKHPCEFRCLRRYNGQPWGPCPGFGISGQFEPHHRHSPFACGPHSEFGGCCEFPLRSPCSSFVKPSEKHSFISCQGFGGCKCRSPCQFRRRCRRQKNELSESSSSSSFSSSSSSRPRGFGKRNYIRYPRKHYGHHHRVHRIDRHKLHW